jgi:acetate kinase
MRILVINSGSSSIKYSVFDTRAGEAEPVAVMDGELSGEDIQTPEAAVDGIFGRLCAPGMPPMDAVGYRVVHPGPKLHAHQRITEEVLRELDAAAVFAPLHDPGAVAIIRQGMERFSSVPHFACFDTVFHQTMPEEATTYAIPKRYRDRGVRRYGFHGLSCESAVRLMRKHNQELPRRMVIAHLGSGCSVTAVRDGASVDTTMGLTPDGGVVMGTRPGDLDPGVVFYLMRQQKSGGNDAVAAVEKMLNREAGMAALSGMANDLKKVREAAGRGDAAAMLALRVFTRSVTKAIGGFAWLLGGLDAIVFTGGIGEHDAQTRAEVLGSGEGLGVRLDAARNECAGDGLRMVSAAGSATAVFVVPAEEDLMIALHVARMAAGDEAAE